MISQIIKNCLGVSNDLPSQSLSQPTQKLKPVIFLEEQKKIQKLNTFISTVKQDYMLRSTTARLSTEQSVDSCEIQNVEVANFTFSFDINSFVDKQKQNINDRQDIENNYYQLVKEQKCVNYNKFSVELCQERLEVCNGLLMIVKANDCYDYKTLFKAMQYFDQYFYIMTQKRHKKDLKECEMFLSIELGITCLLVSSKMNDYYPMTVPIIMEILEKNEQLQFIERNNLIACEKIFLKYMRKKLLDFDIYETFLYFQQLMIDTHDIDYKKKKLKLIASTQSQYIENFILYNINNIEFLQNCGDMTHSVYILFKRLIKINFYQNLIDKALLVKVMTIPVK